MELKLASIDSDTVTAIRNWTDDAQETPGPHTILVAAPTSLEGDDKRKEWQERLSFVKRLIIAIKGEYEKKGLVWRYYIRIEAAPERPATNRQGKYDHLLG